MCLDQYCICGREEFGKMIFCDGKDCPIGWWHFECAGVSKTPKGMFAL